MSELTRALTSPPIRSSKCGFRNWLVLQSEADQAAINAALDDKRWSSAALLNILASAGLPIKENSLRRHRLGVCSCGSRDE